MPEKSKELANLARIGKLAIEPGTSGEIKGMLVSGFERLARHWEHPRIAY